MKQGPKLARHQVNHQLLLHIKQTLRQRLDRLTIMQRRLTLRNHQLQLPNLGFVVEHK